MEPSAQRKPPTPEDLLEYARKMRARSTDAEKRLWRILRNRRCGGFKFRRQVPIGRYIIDFYCHEAKLVVEADGGQHSEATTAARDAVRTEFLKAQGIRVVRFWDHDILRDSDCVREMIYRALISRNSSPSAPHPNPLPEGEGAEGARRNRGDLQ
jgi:very-short-patch-repair endonuclease